MGRVRGIGTYGRRRAPTAALRAAILAALPATLPAAILLGPALSSAQTAAPGSALNADESAGPVKVCSPVALPRWRSVTPVPRTWTFTDCLSFSGEMGADHFQLGCLFANVTPYAQKYAWGALVKIETAALAQPQAPVPNCGW